MVVPPGAKDDIVLGMAEVGCGSLAARASRGGSETE